MVSLVRGMSAMAQDARSLGESQRFGVLVESGGFKTRSSITRHVALVSERTCNDVAPTADSRSGDKRRGWLWVCLDRCEGACIKRERPSSDWRLACRDGLEAARERCQWKVLEVSWTLMVV